MFCYLYSPCKKKKKGLLSSSMNIPLIYVIFFLIFHQNHITEIGSLFQYFVVLFLFPRSSWSLDKCLAHYFLSL